METDEAILHDGSGGTTQCGGRGSDGSARAMWDHDRGAKGRPRQAPTGNATLGEGESPFPDPSTTAKPRTSPAIPESGAPGGVPGVGVSPHDDPRGLETHSTQPAASGSRDGCPERFNAIG
jgi:hypothetical protein